MSILARCMLALGVFIVLLVFLVVVLDWRESYRKAKIRKRAHETILKLLREGVLSVNQAREMAGWIDAHRGEA